MSEGGDTVTVQTDIRVQRCYEENVLSVEYVLQREIVLANVEGIQKYKLEIGHYTGQGRTEVSSSVGLKEPL